MNERDLAWFLHQKAWNQPVVEHLDWVVFQPHNGHHGHAKPDEKVNYL